MVIVIVAEVLTIYIWFFGAMEKTTCLIYKIK